MTTRRMTSLMVHGLLAGWSAIALAQPAKPAPAPAPAQAVAPAATAPAVPAPAPAGTKPAATTPPPIAAPAASPVAAPRVAVPAPAPAAAPVRLAAPAAPAAPAPVAAPASVAAPAPMPAGAAAAASATKPSVARPLAPPTAAPPAAAAAVAFPAAAPPAPPAVAATPKPAPELDQMKVLEGNWRCDGRAPASAHGPEHAYKSSWKFKRDLDNFWWAAEYQQRTAKDHPVALKARGYMTWDPASKSFVMVGVDNMGGSSTETSSGWTGDVVTLAGDANVGGKKVPYREVITKKGDREFTWRGEMKMGGDWVTLGEDRCKK